jgi:hypothetical protein
VPVNAGVSQAMGGYALALAVTASFVYHAVCYSLGTILRTNGVPVWQCISKRDLKHGRPWIPRLVSRAYP